MSSGIGPAPANSSWSMKALLRLLALWAALAALWWLLARMGQGDASEWLSVAGCSVFLPLAVWLTTRVGAVLPTNVALRLLFWTTAVGGWLAVFLLGQAACEAAAPHLRQPFWIACALAGMVAAWLAARSGLRRLRAGFSGPAAGFSILLVVIAFYGRYFEARTHFIAAGAEERWREIGMPMDELTITLEPQRENAGSAVARQVFYEVVGEHFYKAGTSAEAEETAAVRPDPELLTSAHEILDQVRPIADRFAVPAQPAARLALAAPRLDAAYLQVLSAEDPRWACRPTDGYRIDVPSFLGMRKLAQICVADATRRGAAGDEEGAAQALASVRKFQSGLRENPTLVSLMISVAVDALVAQRQAFLPANDENPLKIAEDVAYFRSELPKRLQLEAWTCLHHTDQISDERVVLQPQTPQLPRWSRRLLGKPYARRQFALSARNNAEHAALWLDPKTYELPDLGAGLDEAISKANPCVWEVAAARAVLRIHATLLLREQGALIREARATLAAGQPLTSRDSVVLRGVRWELIANAETNTVATRLVNPPSWLDSKVIGEHFWILPIDGSAAWQFASPARTAVTSQ